MAASACMEIIIEYILTALVSDIHSSRPRVTCLAGAELRSSFQVRNLTNFFSYKEYL